MSWICIQDEPPPHAFTGYVFNGIQVFQGAIYDAKNNIWHCYPENPKITHWFKLPAPPEIKHIRTK